MRRIVPPGGESFAAVAPPRWDVPLRMVVATAIVVGIGVIAPVIGPRQAGLFSPFPVFGSILAVLTHRVYGPEAATTVLGGLVAGLASPAVFFVTLAATLPWLGLMAFVPATACALATQAATR